MSFNAKAHYRLVTTEDKERMDKEYHFMRIAGLFTEGLDTWTKRDSDRIIYQAWLIMDWDIRFINGNFYHFEWRKSTRKP